MDFSTAALISSVLSVTVLSAAPIEIPGVSAGVLSIPRPPPCTLGPFKLCCPLVGFDRLGPSPVGFDNVGPLPKPPRPPEIPPPRPVEGASCFSSFFSGSGVRPAAFILFFSSNFAISSGDIVRNCGFVLLEDDFCPDAAFFSSSFCVAAAFAAFSFSTCALIAAINASV